MGTRAEPWFKFGAVESLSASYQSAEPFPHIHMEHFLDPAVARELAEEFPRHGSSAWTQYKHYNENKLGLAKRDQMPEGLGRLVDELNGPEFTAWLSQLTGIPKLFADPSLEGGGLHQSGHGGFLNMHADFTVHHHHANWRRRVNLILYLNEDWQENWGGAIELWDRNMTHCVVKVPPLLNHAVIFSTDQDSYHGFPDPLRCPESVTRKSVALYYYTEELGVNARSTDYRPRPGDAKSKAALIWADKQAVSAYSKIKSKLGLSDALASRLLGLFSRSKE
jgi:Rps23 Pro-64 3,4-dihydroxylase Tpa1-like proline 4-hydroxylase